MVALLNPLALIAEIFPEEMLFFICSLYWRVRR